MRKRFVVLTAISAIAVLTTAFAKNVDINNSWPFSAPIISSSTDFVDPEAGDLIFDDTEDAFKGYNGTVWDTFGSASTSSVPIGTILPFGGTSAPSGFLMADGSAVSRSTYSDLFSTIGIAFGQGDGSTSFNLPDLRGRFLRGVDGSAGRDPDDTSRSAMNTGGNTGDNVGSVQDDEFESHTHTIADIWPTRSAASAGSTPDELYSNEGSNNIISNSAGGNETRPKNANVNFIIKI